MINKINTKTLEWLLSRNTGQSSINLCRVYFGLKMTANNFSPFDDVDRNRCLLFLKTISPLEAKDLLKTVMKTYPSWIKQAEILFKELLKEEE